MLYNVYKATDAKNIAAIMLTRQVSITGECVVVVQSLMHFGLLYIAYVQKILAHGLLLFVDIVPR